MAPIRAIVGRLVAVAALAVVFLASCVLGMALHLNTPPVRRLAAQVGNRVLASSLRGTIAIDRLGALSVGGIANAAVHVDDPHGRRVLTVDGLRARIALFTLLRSLASGTGDIVLDLGDVSIDRADVVVENEHVGGLGFQNAFEPRSSGSPSSGGPGRGVHLDLRRIAIASASTDVRLTGLPPLHGDVTAVQGSLALAPGGLTIDVDHFAVATSGMPNGADARGAGAARFDFPLRSAAPSRMQIDWTGTVAHTAATASFGFTGGDLALVADFPRVSAEAVRTLWPASPIEQDVSLHAEARGPWSALAVRAHAAIGDCVLAVAGPLRWDPETKADLGVQVHALDMRVLSQHAPPSRIDATGDLSVVFGESGAVDAAASIGIASTSSIASIALPSSTIRAAFQRRPDGGVSVDATLAAQEHGAKIDITGRLTSAEGALTLALQGAGHAERLDAIAPFGGLVHGDATVSGRASIDIARATIDATLDGEAAELVVGALRVDRTSAHARLSGPLAHPIVDATARANNGDVAGTPWSQVRVELSGPLGGARVSAAGRLDGGPDIRAGATLAMGTMVSLRNVAVSVDGPREHARLHAGGVRIAGGAVDVDDAVVDGLGAPVHLSGRAARGVLHVRARGDELDLGRLGRLARSRPIAGHVAFDVDMVLSPAGGTGRFSARLEDGALGSFRGVGANVDATVDGHGIDGELHAALADVGSISLHTDDLELGSAPVLSSWRRMHGDVRVELEGDLEKLTALIGPAALPFADLGGKIAVKGRLVRSAMDESRPPSVDISMNVAHLTARASAALDAAPGDLTGANLDVGLRIDGRSGATELTADVRDAQRGHATLDAAATIPYERLVASPDRAGEILGPVGVRATLVAAHYNLSSLAGTVLPKGYRGEIEGAVDIGGTVARPTVELNAQLTKGRMVATGAFFVPFDAELRAHYDGARIEGDLTASTSGKPVLTAHADIALRMTDVLNTHETGAVPWDASGHATIAGFPIERFRALDDRQVRGKLNAELSIDGLHRDATASLAVETTDLQIRDIPCRSVKLTLTANGQALDGVGRIEQGDSSADVRLHAGSKWGSALLPALDATRPLEASLKVDRLRAALLLPLLDTTFNELDGQLDADAHIKLDAVARTGTVDGTASLSKGTVEIIGFGGELHDVSAKVVAAPDGTVRLESLQARGLSGQIQAAGSARLDEAGVSTAAARVQIAASQPMPLSVADHGYGTVDGRVDLTATRSPDRKQLTVNVDIPTLHVKLPTTSPRDVQPLEPLKQAHVGIHAGGAFVAANSPGATADHPAAAPDRQRVQMIVKLGNDVAVRRGDTLNVALRGRPTITLGESVGVSGQIQLLSGYIDVQGKRFDIEQGTVTFVGDDPSNPQTVVSATWNAPEGTRIRATFVGPLKTGVVKLSSEPPLPQNEIIALVLFGSTDGMGAQSSGGATTAGNGAIGAAGSTAAQPLNRALQQFGLGGVSTRVDTTAATPRPEVKVQIARDIALQVAWLIGAPPPGSNPDRTFFTLDWRFIRRWSLETTIGDAGTSIMDVIWQYRY